MQIEYTPAGLKITHPNGFVVTHTKEQLQTQIANNQQVIDRLTNDNLRLANDIDQVEAAGG